MPARSVVQAKELEEITYYRLFMGGRETPVLPTRVCSIQGEQTRVLFMEELHPVLDVAPSGRHAFFRVGLFCTAGDHSFINAPEDDPIVAYEGEYQRWLDGEDVTPDPLTRQGMKREEGQREGGADIQSPGPPEAAVDPSMDVALDRPAGAGSPGQRVEAFAGPSDPPPPAGHRESVETTASPPGPPAQAEKREQVETVAGPSEPPPPAGTGAHSDPMTEGARDDGPFFVMLGARPKTRLRVESPAPARPGPRAVSEGRGRGRTRVPPSSLPYVFATPPPPVALSDADFTRPPPLVPWGGRQGSAVVALADGSRGRERVPSPDGHDTGLGRGRLRSASARPPRVPLRRPALI